MAWLSFKRGVSTVSTGMGLVAIVSRESTNPKQSYARYLVHVGSHGELTVCISVCVSDR